MAQTDKLWSSDNLYPDPRNSLEDSDIRNNDQQIRQNDVFDISESATPVQRGSLDRSYRDMNKELSDDHERTRNDIERNGTSEATPMQVVEKKHHHLQLSELTDQTNLLPFKKVVSVFLGLAVCIVVSTLDQTLVATALPSISSHFHAGKN